MRDRKERKVDKENKNEQGQKMRLRKSNTVITHIKEVR